MVEAVLLVGGSSQLPLVQRLVREAFGADKVVVHPRPMYAVAEGAAIVAAGLTEKVATISRDYYIKLIDGLYKVISRQDAKRAEQLCNNGKFLEAVSLANKILERWSSPSPSFLERQFSKWVMSDRLKTLPSGNQGNKNSSVAN